MVMLDFFFRLFVKLVSEFTLRLNVNSEMVKNWIFFKERNRVDQWFRNLFIISRIRFPTKVYDEL